MIRALKVSRFALAAVAGVVCLFSNDNLSSNRQSSLVTQADARIGRPLTPMSVAGVARRQYRRGAIVGGAAIGAGAYYGYGAYPNYYGAYGSGYGPYYGRGYYNYSGGDNGAAYCVQRFRSYDPASGTYLGNDGRRHACP